MKKMLIRAELLSGDERLLGSAEMDFGDDESKAFTFWEIILRLFKKSSGDGKAETDAV